MYRRVLPILVSLALTVQGCAQTAASKQSEAMVRQQTIQVRQFDTSSAAVFGLEKPPDYYGQKVAEMLAAALQDDGMKATVLGPTSPPTATMVIEGRVLTLDGGNRALRWAAGFGAGAVEVAIEGRAIDANGKVIGQFHSEETGKGGFVGGNTDALFDECMDIVATDAAMQVISGEYSGRSPDVPAAEPVARAFDPSSSAAINKIVVTPGDIAGGRYEILGQIEWPSRGDIRFGNSTCDPNRIRNAAFEQYGDGASAVIGFHTWEESGLARCGGTVVRFTDSK